MYLADIVKSVPECSKINLRASKIQNFSGGAYPQTPLQVMRAKRA